ncbi:MAG TPA: tyrosine-protein phosphatase [Desulfomonilia bacterium]|nr:tyrosine-protein phosphatase [Desulfomonilia bacterium]
MKSSSVLVRISIFILFLILSAGCAHRPYLPPSRVLEKPCDTCMAGVPNFARVSDALWRGAQPSSEGFRSLEAAGVKTIVDLRHTHDDLPSLAGTKLKYLWLPEQPDFPEEKDLVIFLKVIENPDNRPVFVHCKEGKDRTGYMVAAYRIIDQGWSVDDAIHEMFDFHYNPVFFENTIFLRGLDKEKIRQRVKRAP